MEEKVCPKTLVVVEVAVVEVDCDVSASRNSHFLPEAAHLEREHMEFFLLELCFYPILSPMANKVLVVKGIFYLEVMESWTADAEAREAA